MFKWLGGIFGSGPSTPTPVAPTPAAPAPVVVVKTQDEVFAEAQAAAIAAGYAWLAQNGYTTAQVNGFFVPQANANQAALKLSSGGYGQVCFTVKAGWTSRTIVTSANAMAAAVANLLASPDLKSIDSVGPLA